MGAPAAMTGAFAMAGAGGSGVPGHTYSPQGGHHKGIGRAIYYPYSALFNSFLFMLIIFDEYMSFLMLDIEY